MLYPLFLSLLIVLSFSQKGWSDGSKMSPYLATKLQGTHRVLKGDQTQWQLRAQKWFTHEDSRQRRKQMREITRSLKAKCYTCHTRGFKGYIDEMYLISLQMMALSSEFKIGCVDCHLGSKGLSQLGAVSYVMWRYSVDHQKECTECHQIPQKIKSSSRPFSPFKELTQEGKKAKSSLIHLIRPYFAPLKFSPQLIQLLTQKWSPSKSSILLSPLYNSSSHFPDSYQPYSPQLP